MEMTLLTREQLKLAYDRDLSVSFPRDELKPFRAMAQMLGQGSYRAWGLMDGEDIAGLATVWNYAPGWALFDYLCVRSGTACFLARARSRTLPPTPIWPGGASAFTGATEPGRRGTT